MPVPPLPGSNPPVALTIAGFDPSSGAGITADVQVFAAHGIFGTACITALTVQSTLGVFSVTPIPELIAPTLAYLTQDLVPAGIKIGMLATEAAVHAVVKFLRSRADSRCPVVLDPVLVSSSGFPLLDAPGIARLRSELLPLVDWITPNRSELAILSATEIATAAGIEPALETMRQQQPHLFIVATSGGHEPPTDFLMTPGGDIHTFAGRHIATASTHGTGCAFSSALLSRLVLGDTPPAAVHAAKAYVTEALRTAPGLGHGKGPLNLLWPLHDHPGS